MNISTKFLGDVTIQEEEILYFEQGLLGIEETKKFVLLPIDTELPLAILQSVEQAEISFIVALPFAFKSDFIFDLTDEDIEQLQVVQPEDILTYAIITLADTLKESTLNLLAPIVINTKQKLGKQIVLSDSVTYPLKYELKSFEGSVK